MSADLLPYSGIVLGVDAARVDPAAMAFLAGLGHTVRSIELLTVIPIGAPVDAFQTTLEQIARVAGLTDAVCTVTCAHDPVEVLLDAAGHDRLLVIGCAPVHPARAAGLGDVGRRVLARTTEPVLVVGPRSNTDRPVGAELVVCAHDAPDASALHAAARWVRTFHPRRTSIVGVAPTSVDVGGIARASVRDWAAGMQRLGVETYQRVLHGGDPATWLEDFTADLDRAVYVVSSERYTDGRRHLHSTTRDLIARSAHPILVIPVASARRTVGDRRRSTTNDVSSSVVAR